MDVELINPFIESTVEVIQTMAFTKVSPGKPYRKETSMAMGDVSGIIGINGEASGTISASFTAGCILPIVSSMLGEEIKEMNDDIKDAVGEIANMISGQARQRLESKGRNLKAAIPVVIMGKNHKLTRVTHSPVVAIPFTTDHGEFTIEICFEE